MLEQFLQSILEQVQQPKADLEKNLRALLAEMVSRFNLVSQEEIERQELLLIKAQKTIDELSKQVDALTQQIDALK
jgi:BMFP domain-containing protein YqiC